jgi:hypothetical protein
MVKCLLCNVENRDGRCGHDEKYCYRCCTGDNAEHHDVLTCHFHFSLLPAPLQDARLLTGNVQPDVVDFHAERLRYQENARLAVAAAAVHLPPGGANREQPPSSVPSSPHPVPPHPPQPPAAADVTVVLASLTAALAAVTARLDRIDTGHASTAPASIEAPPPRHRQAVLQPSSSPAALANLFSALDVSDDDDDEQEHKTEVSTQRIVPIPTFTSIFPATLATLPAGSPEDSQQQLARLLATFNKASSATKYATLAELAEAIDDWYSAASKAKWSQQRLKSIYNYRNYVIDTIGRQASLAHAIRYHTVFSKAVQAGEHDFFGPTGHYCSLSYTTVFPQNGTSTTTATAAATGGKKPISKAKKPADPNKKAYAAGSCTNHPLSTTHDTSMCNKK